MSGGCGSGRGTAVVKRMRLFFCYLLPCSLILIFVAAHSRMSSRMLPMCLPQTKVGFLKMHKCASSTVQNILFRYGESHDLNFVLPGSNNYLGKEAPFNRTQIAKVPWRGIGYDMFAVHTVWSTPEVRALLGPAATFVTIVRDPVDLFESLYTYARWEHLFKMSLPRFARAVSLNTTRSQDFLTVGAGYSGHNQMLHDFGLPERDSYSEEKVKQKISEIEQDFDLIMVAEELEASLVLLSELLCWPLDAMVALPVNVRFPQYKRPLDEQTRALLRDWLWADQMLYEHFWHLFQKRKLEFGAERLQENIAKLQRLNYEAREVCGVSENYFDNLTGVFKPSSNLVKGYDVNNRTRCVNMARSELSYIDILRRRQMEKAVVAAQERASEGETNRLM
ncbi:galactosylceramide sulfotransferase-like isoform X2 [Neocloeon triangulifer]|nr:galactosylceramide sulfotransferase-like isoform X2 [Neocloeon triangulifer]XP_059468489.1 galactosylceramide sulfotransferase-like isoform X2 [Neocloeon triangulifer]XP_059468490.1 galactosylceramide sulfotransferase-like isoform X2 [Neocloeon triangulifer]XP_059468491.1 galactosylceramide sulfotransferase-like isoform X2 [Neocloeon triangulifer]